MENATKALIIAGTILIAVLLLSVGVYLFLHYSNFSYNIDEDKKQQRMVEYNTKFEKYEDKKLTAQDVLTIVNLAKDYNERHDYDIIGVYLLVLKKGMPIEDSILGKTTEWIENNNNYYKISKIEKYETGTIKKVVLKIWDDD